MKRRKIPIKYSKERVILSDVLPFEIPLTYSNRYLYKFLITNKVKFVSETADTHTITWQNDDPTVGQILKILFGFKAKKELAANTIKIDRSELRKIPFQYKISHKDSDFRELTIIHPHSQLALIDFYDQYKDLILYYSNVSPFSVRKPNKVAKYIYHKPKKKRKEFGKSLEENFSDPRTKYENLKNYFHLKNYNNIFKFYESYRYHQCEKKYKRLFRFDIAKCFDSIYTHSIAWALLNKDIVKDTLPASDSTFAGKFDKLMQNLNYGETNGIVIGPEFSRIFAELIMQQIDNAVYLKLKEDEDIILKRDYELFRYVDDFFVFFNDDAVKEKVLSLYKIELKKYKLEINDAKSKLYEKPIITEISIAKQKISDLLNSDLVLKINDPGKANEIAESDDETDNLDGINEGQEIKYNIYVSSNRLITKFKTIIKEANIDYKDILNYVLASLDKKVEKMISSFDESGNSISKQNTYVAAFLQILDFAFFLYSGSPRVNSTIKLCMTINKLTSFINRNNKDKTETFTFDNKHRIFKKISDEICQVLNKNSHSEHIQVETLYLLVALNELGREYRLDINLLCRYFNIDNAESKFTIKALNYFSITVLLFYIKDTDRYKLLRYALMKYIKTLFKPEEKEDATRKAELTFLLFDVLTCPYLNNNSDPKRKYEFKRTILKLVGVESSHHINIIEKESYWFTKWTNFDFGGELESKKSQEAYG